MENHQMKENAYSIYIKNKSFLPELFNININDTIIFCNMDKIECCIFSKSFSSFPNVYIPANDKFIFIFSKSGKYELCIKDNKHNTVIINCYRFYCNYFFMYIISISSSNKRSLCVWVYIYIDDIMILSTTI